MRRQLYKGGGIANLQRQGYFLGGITDILGKAGDVVKQVVKSDVGRAALLGATMYGLGGGTFFGKGFPGMGGGFSMGNILPNIGAMSGVGKATLGAGAALAFGGGDPTKTKGFDMAKRKGNVEEYLRRYYKEYKQSDWQTGWTQDEEDAFVARYTSEYNQGGRVGLYAGGDPEDYPEAGPEINIQDLIQEEGIQVGPQVKREGIQSLDAGAPSIKRTGNMETEDSQLVERYNEHKEEGGTMSFEEFEKVESMTAYYPGDVFSKSEISSLFRDRSLTTNMDRKQLHKILKNPGMFPDAENELKILLRRNQATGGRVGAFGGGVMGGRVGLKVLRDLFDEDDEEEEAAQGGRIGYGLGGTLKRMLGLGRKEGRADPSAAVVQDPDVLREKLMNHFRNKFGYQDWKDDFRDEWTQPFIQAAQGGRVGAFGGGVMGIGTPGMRLPGIPQMAPDGMEYDMRAGGFQPLGAREGKDDVKANLAKNEFVMTADAVRGAGNGNIEVGAQKMYDTMKQLEGKVV